MPRRKALNPGDKYGRLTVIEYAGTNKYRSALWKCVCECGKETIVRGTELRGGHVRSCGCFQREVASKAVRDYNTSPDYRPPDNTKHGKRHSRLYGIWCNMKQRCYNPNSDRYKYYGGKGVTICDEWLHDFSPFHEWAVSNGYADNLSIDRIDVNGPYSPTNCRWTNQTEQVANRTNTVRIEYHGVTKPLAEWCRELGVNYKTAHAKLKNGETPEMIFGGTKERRPSA